MIITKIYGIKLEIYTDYTGLGKIQYILGQRGMKMLDTEYTDAVKLTVLVPEEEQKSLEAELIEGTNGQVRLETGDSCWFAEIDGQIEVL